MRYIIVCQQAPATFCLAAHYQADSTRTINRSVDRDAFSSHPDDARNISSVVERIDGAAANTTACRSEIAFHIADGSQPSILALINSEWDALGTVIIVAGSEYRETDVCLSKAASLCASKPGQTVSLVAHPRSTPGRQRGRISNCAIPVLHQIFATAFEIVTVENWNDTVAV